MIAVEPYLKTQRVAEALGISVSTVKRWVDSGTIRAARTVGKHRLIPFSEALRLAREHGFPEANLEILAGVAPAGTRVGDQQAVNLLEKLLREGRAAESRTLIHSLYRGGWDAPTLADDLIRPVMERIGHGWMVGSLDVYQEHEATQIVTAALRDLVDGVGRDESGGPIALGANTEGDPYVLAGLLGELVLRDLGWKVRNLGCNLPLRSLAQATLRHRPRLIFISVSYLKDEEQFVREYQSFYVKAVAVGAAVVVGGPALAPHVRSRLLYASYGERMAHLAEFARRLSPPESSAQAEEPGQ
jgi:MerR family transcriptional regulator, light-induced transcriptional regulator